MASKAAPDYRTTLDDLSRWLRSNRSNCLPTETARKLLAYDNPGHSQLIGIECDGKRAILFNEPGKYAISVEFGSDGLEDGGPKVASFHRGQLESWIKTWKNSWGWLHPRYRWVIE